jgi:hypothetical protein|tara:strand:- start:811 stop:1014 length:204 start_codon:yes stop_codon:yes gene_type:complete
MRFLAYTVRGDELAYGDIIYLNPFEVSSIMDMDSGKAMITMKDGCTYQVQETALSVRSDVESAYITQ